MSNVNPFSYIDGSRTIHAYITQSDDENYISISMIEDVYDVSSLEHVAILSLVFYIEQFEKTNISILIFQSLFFLLLIISYIFVFNVVLFFFSGHN